VKGLFINGRRVLLPCLTTDVIQAHFHGNFWYSDEAVRLVAGFKLCHLPPSAAAAQSCRRPYQCNFECSAKMPIFLGSKFTLIPKPSKRHWLSNAISLLGTPKEDIP
jgi:hypothetical protein